MASVVVMLFVLFIKYDCAKRFSLLKTLLCHEHDSYSLFCCVLICVHAVTLFIHLLISLFCPQSEDCGWICRKESDACVECLLFKAARCFECSSFRRGLASVIVCFMQT